MCNYSNVFKNVYQSIFVVKKHEAVLNKLETVLINYGIYIKEYNVASKEMRDVDVLERCPWY